MKLPILLFALLGLFTTFSAAWSKEDREIFRIRDEIRAHEENPDMSFYDLLGVKQSASIDDITKAYRKIIRSLHPDKVRQQIKAERAKNKKTSQSGSGVNVNKPPTQREIDSAIKIASDRQARLSLVRNIISGPERDRYDHFLNYGFPAWKGTNYYYDRYRPGFGTAITGVFLFAGGAIHYLVLRMNYSKRKDFLERYIKFARDQAWGDNLNIPGIDYSQPPAAAASSGVEDEDAPAAQPVNRRQRRMQEAAARKEKTAAKGKKNNGSGSGSGTATPRESSAAAPDQTGPTGPRKRVIAENGKVLVVDDAGNVFLEEYNSDGQLEHFLLDPNELQEPSFKDTAVVRLPIFVYNRCVGRLFGGAQAAGQAAAAGPDAAASHSQDVDSDNDPLQNTPSGSTDSANEDFEMLDKSTDSLGKAKSSSTGAQSGGGGGKANKRKNKKR